MPRLIINGAQLAWKAGSRQGVIPGSPRAVIAGANAPAILRRMWLYEGHVNSSATTKCAPFRPRSVILFGIGILHARLAAVMLCNMHRIGLVNRRRNEGDSGERYSYL